VVVRDDQYVYWASGATIQPKVQRVRLDGVGGAQTVLDPAPRAYAIAVDATHVYLTVGCAGATPSYSQAIVRFPKP
jgi:hypothetical protein